MIKRLRWILSNRKNGNRKMSMRALSLNAGLTAGHVEQIINRRQSANIEGPTSIGLARAGDVRLHWLMTGEGEPGRFDGSAEPEPPPAAVAPSATPPPATATPTSGERTRPLRDHPHWTEAEAEARERHLLPGFAWERAGGIILEPPPERIDAATVATFAQACLMSTVPTEELLARLATKAQWQRAAGEAEAKKRPAE